MRRARFFGLTFAAVAALALAACQDDSTPTSPDTGPLSARVQSSQPGSSIRRRVRSPGSRLRRLLPEPGWTASSIHPRVESSPASECRGYRKGRDLPAEVRVVEGRYGWSSSNAGRAATGEALAVPERCSWTMTNQHGSGSGRESRAVVSTAAVARLRIPDEAVLRPGDPIVQLAPANVWIGGAGRGADQLTVHMIRGLQRHSGPEVVTPPALHQPAGGVGEYSSCTAPDTAPTQIATGCRSSHVKEEVRGAAQRLCRYSDALGSHSWSQPALGLIAQTRREQRSLTLTAH